MHTLIIQNEECVLEAQESEILSEGKDDENLILLDNEECVGLPLKAQKSETSVRRNSCAYKLE